jgi:hypothetical protein
MIPALCGQRMSQRTAKYVLFFLFLLTVPVVCQLADREWAPAIRLGFLTLLILLLHISEGAGGWLWATMLGLGIAQTLVYAGLFYLVSSLVVRLLARVAKPPIVGAIVTAIAIALLSTSMLEIYYTPISSSRMHSSLFHVFR